MATIGMLPPGPAPWRASGDHESGARHDAVADRPLWQRVPGNALAGWLGPLAVTVFAFVLRLHRLAVPAKAAFDEVYYSCDAHLLVKYGYEHAHLKDNVCIVDQTTPGPGFVVHPPLGKWLIGIGEAIFGYDPNGGRTAAFGWRISACVVGALSILILCRMGRRLFRSTLLGCFAGLLLALDGLHFVQSRIAMLDIFLMFFVVAAAACLVADRDWGRRRLQQRLGADRSTPGPWLGLRPWRIACAVMLGLAIGTKWSAVYHVPVFALVAYAWDSGARRAAGIRKPMLAALWQDGWYILAVFAIVPVLAYLATWTGWFATGGGWRRSCGTQFPDHCGAIAGFVKYHQEILHFHVKLHSPHPYASRPFGWLLLARPVLYVYESPVKGTSQAVLGIGTPAIWWTSILALIGCLWGWVSRRDWRAAFILVAFGAGYLPWFWPPDRTEFLFYALPAVPFLCLALAYCAGLVLGRRGDSPARRQTGVVVVGAYALLVVVNFFYLYPVLAARVIPYEAWHSRMWFGSWI
ncbi:MAG TPA: phospholipid carrier-dependent glycosyltransferase [Mycobacteriales bacterium]|jgi:dolichyl-phosphate-mannose--protein O-mannosyl transferase|nr:phospholipid carrier-dependent glycosyltransferase [Mycobacteriales bacterium]